MDKDTAGLARDTLARYKDWKAGNAPGQEHLIMDMLAVSLEMLLEIVP